MNFDLPHMIVTALLIFVVILGVQRVNIYRTASRGKRFLIMAGAIFVVLLPLNLIWPYGS